MVWAGISAQGKTNLHVIDNGTLTALRYVNEILDVYVRPYAGAVGENFIHVTDSCFITPRATSICTGAQTGSS